LWWKEKLMPNGVLAVLVILIIVVLTLVMLAWFIIRQSSSPNTVKTDAKTQPIVQRFYSSDLKKRALIVRQNDERYRVVFQNYSEKVINMRGEITGWQSLPDQPITPSLVRAVEVAQHWVHEND